MKLNWQTDPTLLALPIDQYSRQAWAAEVVNALRGNKKQLKILDVGGYKGKTSEFFPDDEVVVCDLYDVDEKNYVKGDGRKLPFKDDSFDVVLTFDTYEHIPREGREVFISELERVSSLGVVLAAPFDNDQGSVSSAEVDLNDYHKELYGKDHPWLKEHIDYKIPHPSELHKIIGKNSLISTSLNSNHLDVWVTYQSLYFSIDLDDDLRGRVDVLNREYNSNFKDLDVAPENSSYRQIYFFTKAKNSNQLNEVKNLFESASNDLVQNAAKPIASAMRVLGIKYKDTTTQAAYLNSETIKFSRESKSNRELYERQKRKSVPRVIAEKTYRKIKRP
jgi:hypothetical protein